MKYGSVCSGIEAASVAWLPLGWKPIFFAEVEKFPSAILNHYHPHVPNAGDFTAIQDGDYDAIELLVAGTPCQDFSVAGLRAGMDGKRGQLTVEYAHLAYRLGPKWLVWENVTGVLSIDGGKAFATLLGLLAGVTIKVPTGGWNNSGVIAGASGAYGLAYRVLDAQYFGVPQRRRRVFVVGYLGDWRRAAAVLLEWSGLSGYPPPRREARKGVAGGVEVGPDGGRLTDIAPTLDRGCRDGLTRNQLGIGVLSSTDETSHCLNADGMGRQDFETETLIAPALSADGFDASEDGTGRGTPVVPVAICTAHTQSNGSGFSDDVAHTLESGGAQAVAFAQNTRNEVRLYGGDGKTVGALAPQPGAKQQSYVAFSAVDYGGDAGEIAPTLRSMNNTSGRANGGGQVAIAFTQNQEGDVLSGDVMQSLGTNSNATGRNAPTVAFTLHGSDGTVSAASSTDIAGSLRTRAPGSIENSSTTAVLQEQPVAWSGELTASIDIAGTLQRGGEGGRADGVMTPQMAVRRLTPRECERLQGFPDDYTLVEYRGKPAADGPRYKALGNSMAVPVMRWIGERIDMVDKM